MQDFTTRTQIDDKEGKREARNRSKGVAGRPESSSSTKEVPTPHAKLLC